MSKTCEALGCFLAQQSGTGL